MTINSYINNIINESIQNVTHNKKLHDNINSLIPYLNNCYSPYSKFNVACMMVANNKKYYGVNVENCSYSLTMCAEQNCVGNIIADGVKPDKIDQIIIISNTCNEIVPCGACRQVMSEFIKPHTKIYTCGTVNNNFNINNIKVYKLKELLPQSFNIDG